MSALITVEEFSVWAQETIEYNDPWTLAVLDAASVIVREAASQPTWTAMNAPDRAKLVVALLGLRTWSNPPTGEKSSSIGGALSSTLLDAVAAGMSLTADEAAALAKLAPAPSSGGGLGGLWVLPLLPTEEPERDIILDTITTDGIPGSITYGNHIQRSAFE